MDRNDGGPASCAWCERPSHIKQGRILLCAMHYRIGSMRSRAKRDGKVTPSREELELIVPSPLVCIGCGKDMTWLRGPLTSRQATLQHDRDGGLRIICLGCNTKHSVHPGDSFYVIPCGHKRCPDCEKVMPVGEFSVDRSRPVGRKSYCRACSAIRHKNWRESHANS
jgi:hypothetical protein